MSIAELTATAVVVSDMPVETIHVRVDVVVDHVLCSVQPDFLRQAVPDLFSREHIVPAD